MEVLSAVMKDGFGAITRMVGELQSLLAEREVDFASVVGRAADALGGYESAAQHPGRWRNFVPPETIHQ